LDWSALGRLEGRDLREPEKRGRIGKKKNGSDGRRAGILIPYGGEEEAKFWSLSTEWRA
jgi:hypothetical protein